MRRWARLALTLLLGAWGIAIARDPAGSITHGLNLAIHETGHLVFLPFGEFLHFAGGTLFQLVVPLGFLGYFLRRGDRHAASLMLWWVGVNLWDIAPYVDDARNLELPLVGGGEHDWNYLLEELGVLHLDHVIARRVHAAGTLVALVATGWGVRAAWTRGAEAPAVS